MSTVDGETPRTVMSPSGGIRSRVQQGEMGNIRAVACQNSHDCAHASDGEWLVSRTSLTSCRWQNLRGDSGTEQGDE